MIESLGSLESKYEIIENIGEGGMGSVFKVRHRILDEVRVVKMMRSHLVHEQESKERFIREARIAAKARHRNIAQIFDFSVDEGVAFIIMEYIDGVTLQHALSVNGHFSLPLALEISQQSLHALAFVHRLGIIHRDIAPDNLMLTADSDGNATIKLIDLGLAKFTEVESALTREGLFLGKLRYASPEQFQTLQGSELGPWSDVYSFGLVLYELLTGIYPIRGRSLAELMAGHVSQPPMPFAESDPEGRIPEALRDVVMRALAKRPESRFRDGKDFRDHILELQRLHPYGRSEKDEAARARQRKQARPEGLPHRTSDQERLARAFVADESSAGDTSTPLLEIIASDVTEAREESVPATSAPPAAGPQPAEPSHGIEPGTGGAAEPPTRPFQAVRPDADRVEGASQAAARTSDEVEPRVARPTSGLRDKVLAAAFGLIVLLAAAAALWRFLPGSEPARPEGPAPTAATGTLVVDAVPWARLVEVRDAGGELVSHGGAEFTPLVLTLAPGDYRVVLRHDQLGERTVPVSIEAGGTVSERVPLGEVDEAELLRSLGLVE